MNGTVLFDTAQQSKHLTSPQTNQRACIGNPQPNCGYKRLPQKIYYVK